MLINHCITWNTCGTSVPLFSNSSMPAEIGIVQIISRTALIFKTKGA